MKAAKTPGAARHVDSRTDSAQFQARSWRDAIRALVHLLEPRPLLQFLLAMPAAWQSQRLRDPEVGS